MYVGILSGGDYHAMTVGILMGSAPWGNRASLGYDATADSDDVTQFIEYAKEIGEEEGYLLSMGR